MLRGIYTGACGMLVNEMRQNITANNLANVDTTGFKKDVAVFSMEPDNSIHRVNDWEKRTKKLYFDRSQYIGDMGTGSVVADVYVSKRQGELKITDKPTDMAISGEGFFALETPRGVMYSRAGNFAISREGFLTDMNGNFVLGMNQAAAREVAPGSPIGSGDAGITVAYERIKVDPDVTVTTGEDGGVYQNGQMVSKVMVAKFEKSNQIAKSGANLLVPVGDNQVTLADDARIKGGMLESSNVNAVYEMVNMIELQRNYEMNQKVILTQDEMLQKAINSVGRLTA